MRAIVSHRGNESLLAGYILSWLKHIDSCAGPLDDVCQAEAPIRKTPIVLVREWLGRERRLEQESPETVRVPGEVMADDN